MTTIVSINADYYRAATLFASRDEYRRYLQAVYVESHPKGGAVITATDGKALISLRDENGSATAPTLLKVLKPLVEASRRPSSAKKLTEPLSRSISVDLYGTASVWSGQDNPVRQVTFSNAVLDIEEYPNWVRVVPRVDDVEPLRTGLALDARHLELFAKAAACLDLGPELSVFAPNGASSPVLVRFPTPDLFGVAMPVRMDKTDDYPEWFDTFRKAR